MSGRKYSDRPFRIWDENAKQPLPHRCYMSDRRAREKALTLLLWLEVGNALTIYDERTGRVVRQFAKRLEGNKVKYVELE